MKDGTLPLKLQVAIRDCWASESSAVQKARAALRDALGCPVVVVEPDWQQLLAALDSLYADRQQLVQAVADCVEVWCEEFTSLLVEAENDDTSTADDKVKQWAEDLMDRLDTAVGLRLHVGVSNSSSIGAVAQDKFTGTYWSEDESAFFLYLSDTTAVSMARQWCPSVYYGDILGCFAGAKDKDEKEEGDGSRDDWADVAMDSATGKAAVVDGGGSLPIRPADTLPPLPKIETLPRPDELFLRPPYHLIVSDYGPQRVVVQGSHSPSLALLGQYFAKWCRVNHHSLRRPPAVAVQYNQSCWGAGVRYDQVTLTAEDNNVFVLNPTLVLAFVEGVLGYGLVSAGQAVWTYRRGGI